MVNRSPVSIQNEIRNLMPNLVELLRPLDGSRIVISGGTGFVGQWLVNALAFAQGNSSLRFEIDVISRFGKDNSPFNTEITKLLNWIKKDFTLDTKKLENSYSHYILGSTPSVSSRGSSNLALVRDATINGTTSVIESIKPQSGLARVINLSSGAADSLDLSEPDFDISLCPPEHFATPNLNYSHAKLQSERIVNQANENGSISGCNLRLYAFAGPLLALDEHFAIGNFMNNALNRLPIDINGNSLTLRSYMYPTDLVNWILKILVSDGIGTFNVGNPASITIGDLASIISKLTSRTKVNYPSREGEFTSYFPETALTEKVFDLKIEVDLDTAILRWWNWLNTNNGTHN